MLTGVSMTHVPYKGDSEMVRDLAGGRIEMGLLVAAVGVPFSVEGRIKPIAVTGSERFKSLPNVPSVSESSIKSLTTLGVYATWGLVGPAGMPPAVVSQINEAVNKVARMPDVAQRLDPLYIKPHASTADEFHQYIETDLTRWRSVAKNLNLS